LQWLSAFATPDTTAYRIQPGRGFEEAAAVFEADFAGVRVRDGWAPYRQFTAAQSSRQRRRKAEHVVRRATCLFAR
jgi:Transposase IS66 family